MLFSFSHREMILHLEWGDLGLVLSLTWWLHFTGEHLRVTCSATVQKRQCHLLAFSDFNEMRFSVMILGEKKRNTYV